MSQENVEIVRTSLEAMVRGDFAAAFWTINPDIEWDARHFPDGRVYHGHEGVREFIRTYAGTFDDYRLVVERYIDTGDRVITFTRESGTSKGTRVAVAAEFAFVWAIRDGQIVRWVGYTDRSEALEAAGLSE